MIRKSGLGPTLVDTGPLVALIDSNDEFHRVCWRYLQNLPPGGLITPFACVVEAMYLLGKVGGHSLQHDLWMLSERNFLHIRAGSSEEYKRVAKLMSVYKNVPMDIADACVVAAAETLKSSIVFTLDSDFYVYRLQDGRSLNVVP